VVKAWLKDLGLKDRNVVILSAECLDAFVLAAKKAKEWLDCADLLQ
jgi:hypothetical protein